MHSALLDAGLSYEDELLPSRRAFSAKACQTNDIPETIREEYQLSTAGLLAILVWLATRGRRKASVARDLLLGLFGALIDEGSLLRLGLHVVADEVVQLCHSHQGGQVCDHIVGALGVAMSKDDGCDQVLLAVLSSMSTSSEHCLAVAHCFKEAILRTAALLDPADDSAATSDPLATPAVVMHASARKRRIDEDFRRAVCNNILCQKRARTVGAFARATQVVSEKTAFAWVGPFLGEYRCAGLLSFSGCRVFSLAFDGSRLGSPKEETLAIACVDAQGHYGIWLPCQVESLDGGGSCPTVPGSCSREPVGAEFWASMTTPGIRDSLLSAIGQSCVSARRRYNLYLRASV